MPTRGRKTESGGLELVTDRLGDERLHRLLVDSSRTFALAIPLLPEATRREVTVAYLLFRIADTLEDAGRTWTRERQLAALTDFERLLARPSPTRGRRLAERWLAEPPTDHDGYRRLLAATGGVLAAWMALPDASRDCIGGYTRRTARLMAEFVSRVDADGVLALRDLEDLRAYCYAVAGVVGEMLTELFVLGSPELLATIDTLRQRAAPFGEGLQLVNILKDSAGDAEEGRHYLPQRVDRALLFGLARDDLEAAAEYALAIQRAGGPDGIVAFTALPVALAWATLDRVEADGPGAKISRETVFELYDRVRRDIAEGRPVLRGAASPPKRQT